MYALAAPQHKPSMPAQSPEVQLCHRGRAGSLGDEVSLMVESPAAGAVDSPADWGATPRSVLGAHSKQPSGGSTVYGSPRAGLSTAGHSKASSFFDATEFD